MTTTSRPVVVMGASGSGKSTLGAALAAATHRGFIDGDALHPPENLARMRAGLPLDDGAREPFLENVARALEAAPPEGLVVACSALKRRYRDFLRARAPDVLFVLPVVGRDTLHRRLMRREGHFMPPSLLDSQLGDLEWPDADEPVLLVDGAEPTAQQVDVILARLQPTGFPSASTT